MRRSASRVGADSFTRGNNQLVVRVILTEFLLLEVLGFSVRHYQPVHSAFLCATTESNTQVPQVLGVSSVVQLQVLCERLARCRW